MLIHDLKNKNKPQTYIAQKGEFISEDNIKLLRLFNGNIQILNKSDQRISEIEFDTYDLDLSPYSKEVQVIDIQMNYLQKKYIIILKENLLMN